MPAQVSPDRPHPSLRSSLPAWPCSLPLVGAPEWRTGPRVTGWGGLPCSAWQMLGSRPGELWLRGYASSHSGESLRSSGRVVGVPAGGPHASGSPGEMQLLGQKLLGFAGFLALTRGGEASASVAVGWRLS